MRGIITDEREVGWRRVVTSRIVKPVPEREGGKGDKGKGTGVREEF
jgi:hypothetical protein